MNLAEADLALPAGMLWTEVREDVQHLLLSGMDFKRAMKWVYESQGIHHLAPREAVCRMLAQVIHAGQLDQTPWCRFVPDGFYTSAEGPLRLRQVKREPTPPWHPLGRRFIKVQKRKQSTRETEALQAKLPQSSDDEVQDPSYELSQAELDKAARAEPAADNDKSSEESDEAEKESKSGNTNLSPVSPRKSKTGNKSDKSTSVKPKSRVITSPKSQTVPKSGGTSRERKMPVLSLATFLRRARVEVPSEGPRRIRSKLAKLNYDDLQGKHLDMVEAACRETHVSYRIFGIPVKFDSYRQSLGYPYFEAHNPDIHILKARWNLEGTKLRFTFLNPLTVVPLGMKMATPWTVTFHYRVTVFYFHEVRDLNSETLDVIKDYVDFMRVNTKAWWAILHWLTISFMARDAADADASRDLYDERRRDVKRLRAQYEVYLSGCLRPLDFRRRCFTTLVYGRFLCVRATGFSRILSVRLLFAVESLTTLLNLTTWTRKILSALSGLRRTATMTFSP
ncbi:hypothetical protein PHMEG_00030393 [Phytophthora megakarya]|uniref:Uncharacterized protein n=1 Tax=Phytophthora megakarya TaxID=4795 RepID=A0A225V0R5_9STRA|nr:hypothetical protein PHMEG_00030393 [Phytophthora megakarya]